jgi:hypothetical protein
MNDLSGKLAKGPDEGKPPLSMTHFLTLENPRKLRFFVPEGEVTISFQCRRIYKQAQELSCCIPPFKNNHTSQSSVARKTQAIKSAWIPGVWDYFHLQDRPRNDSEPAHQRSRPLL